MRLIIITLLLASPILKADKASECSRLWQAERENGCPVMPSEASVEADPARQDFMVNSDFGPTKCVIEENIEKESRGVKKECTDWMKERKSELSGKFLAGTCNPQCTPCPNNELLKRCTVRGEVHYSAR